MVTAEDLLLVANVEPTDFGVKVVPPDVDDPDQQKALVVTYLENHVLPGARSEVDVPLMRVAQGHELPLPDSLIQRRYPNITDPVQLEVVNDNLVELYDNAVKSFARAEMNKLVNTNSASYDRDSDTDRLTADDQLNKLMIALTDIFIGTPNPTKQSRFGQALVGTSNASNQYVF